MNSRGALTADTNKTTPGGHTQTFVKTGAGRDQPIDVDVVPRDVEHVDLVSEDESGNLNGGGAT